MTKIRLTRLGKHKAPFYRVVVAESRARRDGPFVEIIGTYDPKKNPYEFNVDREKALKWLKHGAQPTVTVKKLLEKAGVLTA
ncbi:MAG: 30S ribosomal protein S16 [Nitrospiraceae bacterium]|nr:30S ribosomal protein S16 [Nitrospiraceae bacterium]